jgi:phosphoribosylglycinamide formyltransferase 2
MTDGEALRRLVEECKPTYIIPEIEAIDTVTLEDIDSSGIAEVIPNARAVRLTMNREGIRKLAAEELGLPTSPYVFVTDQEDLLHAALTVGFPCFIKPVMSSSGKGQSIAHDESELTRAWQYAREAGRVKGNHLIVEGKIDFDSEITLLTVRALNARGEVETHFCEPIGHRQVRGDYVESWQPHPLSEKAMREARRIALAVTENLGGRGIFGVELFVRNDRVWFSEVSPRPHDTGLVTLVTQIQSEFDLHARAVLGLPVDTQLRNFGASAVIYGLEESGNIAYEGLDQALNIPQTEVRLFGKPMSLPGRRMGVALASGESVDQARNRAREAAALVRPVPADAN